MELSNSNIKEFLILKETETPKKFHVFSQKKAVLIFRETETLKKLLIFQKVTLPARKMKKLLYFREWKFFYISGGNLKSLKIKNFLYFFSHERERKKFLILSLQRSKIF